MARLINGILGSCSGVIGTIEGNRTKYGGVIKQRKNVSGQNSGSVKTPQRLAYIKTLEIWNSLPLEWKQIFLKDKGNQLSKWNRFVQTNIQQVLNTQSPYWWNLNLSWSILPECDYNAVLQGGMKRIYMQRVTPVNLFPSFKPNDVLYFLLFDKNGVMINWGYGWNRSVNVFYIMIPWFNFADYSQMTLYTSFLGSDGSYFLCNTKFIQP